VSVPMPPGTLGSAQSYQGRVPLDNVEGLSSDSSSEAVREHRWLASTIEDKATGELSRESVCGEINSRFTNHRYGPELRP
jgi:hypothetical protein